MEENMNVVNEEIETTETCEVTETGKKKSKALVVLGVTAVAGLGVVLVRKLKGKREALAVKYLTKKGYTVVPNMEEIVETKDCDSEK